MSVVHKITHPKKRAFLAAYARCASISKAAKRSKVDRRTHYNWIEDDPEYVEAFAAARIEAGDALEDRLAEIGLEDRNTTALIFLLKGHKPEIFRDRTSHELSGPKGGPIEVNGSAEQLIRSRIASLAERSGTGAGS